MLFVMHQSIPFHSMRFPQSSQTQGLLWGFLEVGEFFIIFPLICGLILVKGTECAKAVSINITNKIDKIDVSLG